MISSSLFLPECTTHSIYNVIYISAIFSLLHCWLANLSLEPALNELENPRVALNNRLVASDDLLDLPAMTFDPEGDPEGEPERVPLAALPTELLLLLQ